MSKGISTRTALLSTIAFMFAGTQSGFAQTADTPATAVPKEAANTVTNDDIVVTARRREESLLQVPIAVTAFSGAALERSGAADLTSIQNVTPNTTLKEARGSNSTLAAFIRGVGQQDPVPGFEAGVGIYLDDVYLNRPQAAVLDIYDVERIEVLRGPQGTLYGRNTIGGAIKYVTRRLPDNFALNAKGAFGSYNQTDGQISVSAPLGSGFKIGIAGARLTRDGFGRNTNLNIDNYDKNVAAGRGTVEFQSPDSRMSIRITGDYTHDKSNQRNGHRLTTGILSGAPVLANFYDTRAGLINPRQDIQAGGLSMTSEAEISDHLTVKSISAWRKDRSLTAIDLDSLPAVDVDGPTVFRNEQISQEFQLAYKSEKLNGIFGYYYLDAKASTGIDILIFTTIANRNAYTRGDVRTETSSFFGDFTYDFNSRLSLSLGGRYTIDQRRATIFRANYLGVTAEFGGNPTQLGAPVTDFTGSATFRQFSPRASLNYKISDEHMIYASFSKGFKGGGFDPRGAATIAPDTNQDGVRSYQEIYNFFLFRPETVKSYEIGWKGEAFDRRLNWAINGFYADYSDVQVPGAAGCVVNGQPSFCGITTNAARAVIKGVELETKAIIARDFAGGGSKYTFVGTLGYLDTRYKTFIGPTGADVASSRVFQNSPKWTISGTLGVSLPVGNGQLDGSAVASYRSLTHQFETASPFLDQPGYTLIDGHLNYSFGNGRFSIGLHGKNLTDRRYKIAGYQFIRTTVAGEPILDVNGGIIPTLGKEGVVTAYYGNPRQFFATFGVKF